MEELGDGVEAVPVDSVGLWRGGRGARERWGLELEEEPGGGGLQPGREVRRKSTLGRLQSMAAAQAKLLERKGGRDVERRRKEPEEGRDGVVLICGGDDEVVVAATRVTGAQGHGCSWGARLPG